jgi:hypothetical protein
MALGLNYAPSESGEITPILKFDARAGRWFRVDREDGTSIPVDITSTFAAVFDLENIAVGWLAFSDLGPVFKLGPIGDGLPPRPSDAHKQGFRVRVKLAGPAGGDIREFSSSAKAVLGAIDVLHDEYLKGVHDYPGQLPVVRMSDTRMIQTKNPKGTTTAYAPVFEVVRWVARPADLKSVSPDITSAPMTKSAPPITGATKKAPPSTSSAAPVDLDDFG